MPCHPRGACFEFSTFIRPCLHGFIKLSILTQICFLDNYFSGISEISCAITMVLNSKAC